MRPRVVIIDADATMRGSLRALLATLDVEVDSFDSAEQYLAQVPKAGHTCACLIVDVSLPGMSGLELLQQIRVADREVPVVLLTSEAEVPIAVEAMRHGATDFIEKAQLDVALLRRVSQLLRTGTQDETRDTRRVTR